VDKEGERTDSGWLEAVGRDALAKLLNVDFGLLAIDFRFDDLVEISTGYKRWIS
jgi:hypothetical protein